MQLRVQILGLALTAFMALSQSQGKLYLHYYNATD